MAEMMKLENFMISPDKTIFDALKKIDKNQQGFLIIADEERCLLGTFTDGDIRRAMLAGQHVGETIGKSYHQNCYYVYTDDDFLKVVELFQTRTINFLPVVDKKSRRVKNCITRKQLQWILLQDLHPSLTDDFLALYDVADDYNIHGRPWGFYKTTVINDYFQSKVIHVSPQAALSLQKHNRREEYWIVVHGTGDVQLEDSIVHVREGSSLFIPKGCKHRVVNTSKVETLILTEVQIGDYFGEDDIIRLEDRYGRV